MLAEHGSGTGKPGILIDIPGFGRRRIEAVVSDYTGTQSCGGRLAEGVRERLKELARRVEVYILTADTFGTAREELNGLPVHLEVLQQERQDVQKQEYVRQRLDPSRVAALGNGNNDRLLLEAVKQAGGLAIAVDGGEGCAIQALLNADLLIRGAANALDLLLEPNRTKATLRF